MKFKPFDKIMPCFVPEKGSLHSAGYDLRYVGNPTMLEPNKRLAFSTNLVLEIPSGYYGRIAPRSGLAVKHGIDVLAGCIDSDFRGEIKVILINLGDKPVSFQTGDKIAQIIFENHHDFLFDDCEDLSDTSRGEKGFGSTG